MKNQLKFGLLFILVSFNYLCFGQDFMYLDEIKLSKKSDFIENEQNVIKAVDFLYSTPLDEKNINRALCNQFIIKYAQKSPFITMTLDGSILSVTDDNKELLSMYMGAWLKSAIQNKGKSESFYKVEIFTAIAEYAKKGNNVTQTKHIESLIEALKNGEIDTWLKEL